MSQILLPTFFPRILMIVGLTFKTLIHFEFMLEYSLRRWPSFLFLHVSELTSKTETTQRESSLTALAGGSGVEGLRKKDSWTGTTVRRLHGEGSIRGINGNGKSTIKNALKQE